MVLYLFFIILFFEKKSWLQFNGKFTIYNGNRNHQFNNSFVFHFNSLLCAVCFFFLLRFILTWSNSACVNELIGQRKKNAFSIHNWLYAGWWNMWILNSCASPSRQTATPHMMMDRCAGSFITHLKCKCRFN